MTRRWTWHGLSLDLPLDWEMLQFSTLPAHGRCTWADRNQFRVQIAWRTLPGEPDLERMLDDYATKIRQTEPAPDEVERVREDGWPGLLCRRADSCLVRFARFVPVRQILAEVLFIHPGGQRDAASERSILATFGGESAVWRTFGMRIEPPAEFTLTACEVRPAQARLVFSHPKDPLQVLRVERLGMLGAWLRAPVREWAAARLQSESAEGRLESRREHHVTAQGVLRRPGWVGRLRRPLPFRIDAWIEPADGRLYTAWAVGEEATRGDRCRLAPQDAPES